MEVKKKEEIFCFSARKRYTDIRIFNVCSPLLQIYECINIRNVDGDDDVLAYKHNICAYMVKKQKRHKVQEKKRRRKKMNKKKTTRSHSRIVRCDLCVRALLLLLLCCCCCVRILCLLRTQSKGL